MPRRRPASERGATPARLDAPPAPPAGTDAGAADRPSFRDRSRLRRRLHHLRRVRELGFRDLGGLVFDQHRFDRRDEALVNTKLAALAQVDRELREIEHALRDERPIIELREAGVSTCSRCGALIGSDARFCAHCGTPAHEARRAALAEPEPEPQPLPQPAPPRPQIAPAAPIEATQELHLRAEDAVEGEDDAAPTTIDRPAEAGEHRRA